MTHEWNYHGVPNESNTSDTEKDKSRQREIEIQRERETTKEIDRKLKERGGGGGITWSYHWIQPTAHPTTKISSSSRSIKSNNNNNTNGSFPTYKKQSLALEIRLTRSRSHIVYYSDVLHLSRLR